MKTILHRCAFIALSSLSFVSTEAAYNPAVVAADARWVVYADLDTLRASALGKELVSALTQAQAQSTGGTIGLDIPRLLTTVGSLTAYGTNLATDPNAIDGALIAQGTADLRKIAEGLLLQGTLAQPDVFVEVKDLPYPAYAIGNPKAPAGQQTTLIVAFPPEPIVIASKSKAQLLKAREVFRGAAPSLARAAGTAFTKFSSVGEGAYLFAASIMPAEPLFPQNATQARLLQLTSSAAIAFGEQGADTFIRSELHASSEANAEKLLKILQGLTAMLSMAETTDRQLTEFLNATTVERNKDVVTLRLAYPTARLVQISEALHASAEAKPPVRRAPPITMGKTLAEWGSESGANSAGSTPELAWRTIENVALVNGSLITVGRAGNGGQNARIDRVEIVAAAGSGTPLVWRTEAMRGVGGRGTMWQFPFPGAAGTYTLKVAYLRDAEGKATFAASVVDPSAPKSEAPSNKGPLIPQPKLVAMTLAPKLNVAAMTSPEAEKPEKPEADIVRAAAAGDAQAFAELVHRHHRRVLHYLCHMLRHRQDAEDLTQQTFLKAFRHLKTFDCARPLVNWLLTIARRTALNHFRDHKKWEEMPAEYASDAPSPARQVEHQDHANDLWARARRLLSAREFEVLWLRFSEEMSTQETARTMGLTQIHVKVLVHRARQQLLKSEIRS